MNTVQRQVVADPSVRRSLAMVLFRTFGVGAILCLIDQWTKILAVSKLKYGESVEIIPKIFNLTLVYNKGAAFGLFSALPDPWRQIVLWSTSITVVLLLFLYLVRGSTQLPSNLMTLAIGLVLGGAVGNAIDRAKAGMVVDFLDFYYGSYHWPAFNVADSAICVGVFVLLLVTGPEKKQPKDGPSDKETSS